MGSGFISGLTVQAEVIQGHLVHAVGYTVVLFLMIVMYAVQQLFLSTSSIQIIMANNQICKL